MDTSTRLKGHGLLDNGSAHAADANDQPYLTDLHCCGFALCECGARSDVVHGREARRKWHREVHKPEVRARMGGSDG